MDAATTGLVLSQVQRVLDAEVIHQNRKMKLFFDTRKVPQKEILKGIEEGDRQAGTAQHTTSWNGEIMEVDWPAANLAKIDQITQTVTETKPDGSTKTTTTTTRPNMSITGLQSGVFQAKLAEMRQKMIDKQNAGLSKIDGIVTAGGSKMDEAIANAEAKANKEVEDALQEFATFSNGGPA